MTKPVLGRADSVPSTQIDTFAVDGIIEQVTFESSELLAICPVTDGPDVYDITVTYTPAERCIETKSLKLYLQTFRDEGIFAEHLAPRIAGHLAASVGTSVRVVLRQHVRGGIVTTVSATAPS
jgi:7-cyano-7-deazaguanine reductase